MKQGMSYGALVEHVEHEAACRRDFYVPTKEMQLVTDSGGSILATPCGQFQVRDMAHLHLSELVGIDRRYYQRMRKEAPFLLDRNVNHWLANTPSKQRIIRALEAGEVDDRSTPPTELQEQAANGRESDASTSTLTKPLRSASARAVVSSRYAMLDNDALLKTVEPVIEELGLSVESCDVGEERLVIKMVSPRLKGDVKVGDPVQAGIVIKNSEVRCSAVEIGWFIKRLVCTNGMIVMGPGGRGAFRRHVGRDWEAARRRALNGSYTGLPEGVLLNGVFTNSNHHNGNSTNGTSHHEVLPVSLVCGPVPPDEERDAWEKSVWEGFNTSLRENLNAEAFTKLLERLTLTTRLYSGVKPEDVVERVGNAYHLRPHEQEMVLLHLLRDGDMSLWGLLNAVTRSSQDVADYARATDLEELGGILAHLTPAQWDKLVQPN